MNHISTYIYFAFSLLFLEACTSDGAIEEVALSTKNEVTKIEAISLPFNLGEGNSRTSITMGNNSIELPIWAKGDTIGIFPSAGGDQLSFPIIDGIGTNTCVFTGGGWALKPSTASTTYTYTAYTPFNRNYYSLKDNTALPVSMVGQKQTGNNNSDHLGAYDLQIANGDTPINGKISFAFQHKVAIVRMDITAPCAASWKSITLNSTAAFTTKATMNLSLSTPTVVPKEQSNSITLDLKNVSTTTDNLQIVAYMMMLPVNFTNKTLIMELVDTDANMYTAPVSIDNPTNVANPLIFGASNARWISAKFEKGASPSIPYITFIADDNQTLTMSQAVTTLEYSVNGGNWQTLGTNTVTFGGNEGALQLRGKNENGTNGVKIIFGNTTSVACLGDIRTLLDYEHHSTVNTNSAKFGYLFFNCSNLTSAPKLPATRLADNCYEYMFWGCSSLKAAPELPATTLSASCYFYMFHKCISLVYPPELPAMNIASGCYYAMFNDCSNLTSAPKLPAMTLETGCYAHMFAGCTSLTAAPNLPATTLAINCYYCMFNLCSSLTTAPRILPATILTEQCYGHMFSGTNLSSMPELPATTLAPYCYYNMFSGCKKLTSVSTLPATKLAPYCYEYMFSSCTDLTLSPKLPATTLANSCYFGMFHGCTSLTIAPELPATTLAESCYNSMFGYCTSLTIAPELPATTLVERCYQQMFNNCSKLEKITMLATSIGSKADDYLWDWTWCVASTGTFIKAKEMESLPLGENGIPKGWNVIIYK